MKKIAGNALTIIFSLMIIFHILVLFKIIPYTVVWGGNLQSPLQMYIYESITLAINLLFLSVVLMRMKRLKAFLSVSAQNIFLGLMAALFLLNTIGNFYSESFWEKVIFTPVGFLMSLLSLMLLLSHDPKPKKQEASLPETEKTDQE